MLRKSTLAVVLALWGASTLPQSALGSLLLQDQFSYSTGSLPGNGGWTQVTSGGTQIQVTSGNNLSYSGLAPSSGGDVTLVQGNGRSAFNSYTAQSSGSVYFSFILQASTLPGNNKVQNVASLNDSSGNAAITISIDNTNPNSFVALTKASGSISDSTSQVTAGNSIFIVGKYQIVSGAGNDVVSLWVNPSSANFGGTEPTATLTINTGTDFATSISRVYLLEAGTAGTAVLDELRVGTSWADVTPTPEPINAALTIFGGIFLAAGLGRRLVRGIRAGKS